VGKLRGGSFKIVQVIDEENVLGEIETAPESRYLFGMTRSGPETRVIPATREVVWIVTKTEGMADDHWVQTNKVFKVAGTKRYDTAGGVSKTVFMPNEETTAPKETSKGVSGKYSVTSSGSSSMKLELRPDGKFVLKGGGVDEGKWRLEKDVVVMTFDNKAEGNVALERTDGNTLIGRNVYPDGRVFKWVVKKTEEGEGNPKR
jgi:hypothetical protein